MFDKMKQLMEMKKQANKIKKELDSCDVEVTDVKGIRIVINGSQEFKKFEMDQELIDTKNKSKIENDVLRSINLSIRRSQEVAAKKMRAVMPAGFPGM